ncbi:MAG: prepilin-type N-terminal cleavage/methylation domain-containing protein [Pseudomonadota bacterium]
MDLRIQNRKGFSLIELLIGLALLGVVLTAVYQLIISADKSQVAQDLEVEMQQNARSAADFVVRELRNINALSCLENTTTTCSPTSDKITFTSMSDPDTRIFSWSSTDNILRFSKAGAGSPDRQPLADNITACTLSPFDAGNNTTNDITLVKRIDITITARTSRVDPNTNNYRTYNIKTSVMKRN